MNPQSLFIGNMDTYFILFQLLADGTNPDSQCDLYQEDEGHTISELLVQGLMVPDSHPHPCSDAAANDRHRQQCGHWNPPHGFLRFPLVDAVHEECYHVDDSEAEKGNVQEAQVVK